MYSNTELFREASTVNWSQKENFTDKLQRGCWDFGNDEVCDWTNNMSSGKWKANYEAS